MNEFTEVLGEAIQIHNICGNHWVTSYSIGQEVSVYDCMFSGSDLASSLTHQLTHIYRQLQARHVALGDIMDEIEFDLSKRENIKCLSNEQFSPFPTHSKKSDQAILKQRDQTVWNARHIW